MWLVRQANCCLSVCLSIYPCAAQTARHNTTQINLKYGQRFCRADGFPSFLPHFQIAVQDRTVPLQSITVRFPTQTSDISPHTNPSDRLWDPPSVLLRGDRRSFAAVKPVECELTDHPPSSVEGKEYIPIFTPHKPL